MAESIAGAPGHNAAIEGGASRTESTGDRPELIAFYLPQFHPIPENDAWWGKGFTEWTNVARSTPHFPGHAQPRLPTDLGFYDLRVPETRASQAELAKQSGITAFCYYHYWFGGRRLLERPFNDVLSSGEPDFPFLLCWANENWTRRWDGQDREVLMAQSHSEADDRNHLRALVPALMDRRYYRFDGCPVVLIYRTDLLPSPKRTAEIWREEAMKLGVGKILLGRVENFGGEVDPQTVGFDFAVEFAPRWSRGLQRNLGGTPAAFLRRKGLLRDGLSENTIFSYRQLVSSMLERPAVSYPMFRCACPSWDNSPRRKSGATIFVDAYPALFQDWLERLIATRQTFRGKPSPIFVNAWNEWAEGAHLEPCSVHGRAFLDAVANAIAATTARHAGALPPAR